MFNVGGPAGWWMVDRDPRRHMIAERRREKTSGEKDPCSISLTRSS